MKKHMAEMWVTLTNAAQPEIELKALEDYHNMLDAFVKKTSFNHTDPKNEPGPPKVVQLSSQ